MATFNATYNTTFDSLVPDGFYSADPDNQSVSRSERTNNPGALNISLWQKNMKGYVGVTFADKAGNKTTIYRTPEHGVAAWFRLLSVSYKLKLFALGDLAHCYAGQAASSAAIKTYVTGWTNASAGAITPGKMFDLASDADLLVLAKAMFKHELRAGVPMKLSDEQILFGVRHQRAGDMPA